MNIEKTYDYIIYPASLAGVLTAIDLTGKDKNVLLLNFYGFMGGSITESLNCYQNIDENNLSGLTKELFQKIKNAKHGILYRNGNDFIFNPETVKIVLQEELENSKVDLLFHILPFYLKQKEDYVQVSLTGKEGISHVRGRKIIDASEGYDLLKLENVKRSLSGVNYNLFLTGLKDDDWQSFKSINKFIKLYDNRYWLSLKIPNPQNEFFIENNSQNIVNEFETVIQKSGGRVQLIAPQSQKIYEIDKLKISESIFHIRHKLINKYSFSELFNEYSEL
jgi:hypothetical protein